MNCEVSIYIYLFNYKTIVNIDNLLTLIQELEKIRWMCCTENCLSEVRERLIWAFNSRSKLSMLNKIKRTGRERKRKESYGSTRSSYSGGNSSQSSALLPSRTLITSAMDSTAPGSTISGLALKILITRLHSVTPTPTIVTGASSSTLGAPSTSIFIFNSCLMVIYLRWVSELPVLDRGMSNDVTRSKWPTASTSSVCHLSPPTSRRAMYSLQSCRALPASVQTSWRLIPRNRLLGVDLWPCTRCNRICACTTSPGP